MGTNLSMSSETFELSFGSGPSPLPHPEYPDSGGILTSGTEELPSGRTGLGSRLLGFKVGTEGVPGTRGEEATMGTEAMSARGMWG